MQKKSMLMGSLITILVLLLVHLLYITFFEEEIVHIKEVPKYTERITSINEKIAKIKDEKCVSSLKDMLERIKDTYFTEDITLKEYILAYYKDDKTFIDYYEDVNNACSLKGSDEIYFNVLSSMNYPNSLKNRYDLRYEVRLKDPKRDELFKNSDEVGTYTTKMLELLIINELIDEVKA